MQILLLTDTSEILIGENVIRLQCKVGWAQTIIGAARVGYTESFDAH
jgi:hypothetical protein